MNGCKNIDKEVNNIEIKKIIQGKNGKTYICIYMPEMLRYFSLRSIYIYIYIYMNPPPGACRGTPSLFVFRNSHGNMLVLNDFAKTFRRRYFHKL